MGVDSLWRVFHMRMGILEYGCYLLSSATFLRISLITSINACTCGWYYTILYSLLCIDGCWVCLCVHDNDNISNTIISVSYTDIDIYTDIDNISTTMAHNSPYPIPMPHLDILYNYTPTNLHASPSPLYSLSMHAYYSYS